MTNEETKKEQTVEEIFEEIDEVGKMLENVMGKKRFEDAFNKINKENDNES